MRVGINTTPQHTLDVVGTVNATQFVGMVNQPTFKSPMIDWFGFEINKIPTISTTRRVTWVSILTSLEPYLMLAEMPLLVAISSLVASLMPLHLKGMAQSNQYQCIPN